MRLPSALAFRFAIPFMLLCGCRQELPSPPPLNKETHAIAPIDELRSHVERFTGAQAVDCGTFGAAVARAQLEQALACATAAIEQGKAFRAFKGQPGTDSWFAEGVFRAREGAVYRFSYQSTPCGGPGCGSRFAIERCPGNSITLVGDPTAAFTCELSKR